MMWRSGKEFDVWAQVVASFSTSFVWPAWHARLKGYSITYLQPLYPWSYLCDDPAKPNCLVLIPIWTNFPSNYGYLMCQSPGLPRLQSMLAFYWHMQSLLYTVCWDWIISDNRRPSQALRPEVHDRMSGFERASDLCTKSLPWWFMTYYHWPIDNKVSYPSFLHTNSHV